MPLSASIFRRGGPKKELFELINEDVDDSKELDEKLAELEELLHTDKAGRDLSAALWRPELCAAELIKTRKQCARDMGFMLNRKHYLHIEEAVYLVDRGDMLLFAEEADVEEQGTAEAARLRQRLVSVQEAFDLMMSVGVPLERYLLFCALSRSGYLVMRHPSRWSLRRGQHPEQVWGSGAWATCYDRKPQPPGGPTPRPPLQQRQPPPPWLGQGQRGPPPVQQPQPQQAAAGREPAAAAEGTAGADVTAAIANTATTAPMEVDGGEERVPCSRTATGTGAVPGLSGLTGTNQPAGTCPAPAGPTSGSTALYGNGMVAGGAGGEGVRSRGWWVAAGPDHPHLRGVAPEYFQELPQAPVDERLAVSLRAACPRLRPFPSIRSTLRPPGQLAAGPPPSPAHANTPPAMYGAEELRAQVAGRQQRRDATAAAEASSDDAAVTVAATDGNANDAVADCPDVGTAVTEATAAATALRNGGCGGGRTLRQPSAAAHLVYDVYKPGSFVSRSKGVFPVVHTHVAMCSDAPPELSELHATDDATAEAAGGEGGQPARVVWAAVLNGDIALFGIEKADLLSLI